MTQFYAPQSYNRNTCIQLISEYNNPKFTDKINNRFSLNEDKLKRMISYEKLLIWTQRFFGLMLTVSTVVGAVNLAFVASPILFGASILGILASGVYLIYLRCFALKNAATMVQAFQHLLDHEILKAIPLLKSMVVEDIFDPQSANYLNIEGPLLKPWAAECYGKTITLPDDKHEMVYFLNAIASALIAAIYMQIKYSIDDKNLPQWRNDIKVAHQMLHIARGGHFPYEAALTDLVLNKPWEEIKSAICSQSSPPIQ